MLCSPEHAQMLASVRMAMLTGIQWRLTHPDSRGVNRRLLTRLTALTSMNTCLTYSALPMAEA